MTDESKVKISETDLAQLVESLSAEFEQRTIDRHRTGAEKYGPFAFFNKDMFEEAMEEVLDLANYARYAYIKLRLVQLQVAEDYQEYQQWKEAKNNPSNEDLGFGPHGFKPHGG